MIAIDIKTKGARKNYTLQVVDILALYQNEKVKCLNCFDLSKKECGVHFGCILLHLKSQVRIITVCSLCLITRELVNSRVQK